MKSPDSTPVARSNRTGLLYVAKSISTGAHCPLTGLWVPEGQVGPIVFVSEGNLMPAFRGGPVAWEQQRATVGP